MHDSKWVRLDEAAEQLDGISANITALVFETSASQLGCLLPPLGEFLLEVAELDVDLDRSAAAVRVDIQETLLQHIEKGIQLGLVIFAPLLLLAEVDEHVSADFNQGASKGVRL